MVADMQRARMLAWELPLLGWNVEVLTVRASEVRQDIVDSDSLGFFPVNVPVHFVGSLGRRFWEVLGSRTHTWRTLLPVYRMGKHLLRSGRFDLVYFSTTTFPYFTLGHLWQRRFNVPYIVDFHDPWVKEETRAPIAGSWKSRLMRLLSAYMERWAVVNAAGLVSVSPSYITTLRRRYKGWEPAWFAPTRHAIIPFGAMERDLAETTKLPGVGVRKRADEVIIHYIGAGGPIMLRSFGLICRSLSLMRSQRNALVERVRIRLYGTIYNWKYGEPKVLESVAQDAGIGDLVSEYPGRVSYRRSLGLLLESDGALILGVDDPGYMPSKLFGYALSGKPLLASLRRDGPAFTLLKKNPVVSHVIWIDSDSEMPLAEAVKAVDSFLREAESRYTFDRARVLAPYLSTAMAHRHVNLFNACLTPWND